MIRLGMIVVILSIQVCIVDGECGKKDLENLKIKCRISGLNIDIAETKENKTLVCECLQEMFDCVDRTVPNCVASMKAKYVTFTYTPWDCHLLEHEITATDDNKCGRENLFEVQTKSISEEEIDLIPTERDNDETEASRNSCKTCNEVSPLYFLVVVGCVHLVFVQRYLTNI